MPKKPSLRSARRRTALLFFNFMLIIMAIYQVKPASRSLFIEWIGSEQFPYVWIGSAITMGIFIPFYHWVNRRFGRFRVVMGTYTAVTLILLGFEGALIYPHPATVVLFYLFVDVLGVILVEQFWSLCNSIYTTHEGRNWYGLVGTGGLIGGTIGGAGAAAVLHYTPLKTVDLLPAAAVIMVVLLFMNWRMGREGFYCEIDGEGGSGKILKSAWPRLIRHPYLLMIAGLLLLSQIVAPVVEYQFLNVVAREIESQEMRTTFLSIFFGVLGFFSIIVNLGITPVVHRYLGVIPGLVMQPLVLAISSILFCFHPTLLIGAVAKICDRGLGNSINRTSRELLYVPIEPSLVFQAKTLIDMFGFRMFKVIGSFLILLFTRWFPVQLDLPQLSIFSVVACSLWILLVIKIRRHYQHLTRPVRAIRSQAGAKNNPNGWIRN